MQPHWVAISPCSFGRAIKELKLRTRRSHGHSGYGEEPRPPARTRLLAAQSVAALHRRTFEPWPRALPPGANARPRSDQMIRHLDSETDHQMDRHVRDTRSAGAYS